METNQQKTGTGTGIRPAKRIQTSILNGVERKALVWMAERMPRWVTSDMLSGVGVVGAIIIAAGYILSDININYLWLSSFGFVVHWFGDSMDGSLARVRHTQRPIYGFYLDHTLDAVTEFIMFFGAGMSGLLRLDIAMMVFVSYLLMTLNVTINSHLKSEFKLTYAKLGPTEFRLLMIILNTLLIYVAPLREFSTTLKYFGSSLTLSGLDIVAICIFLIIMAIYTCTVIADARGYAQSDPLPKTPQNPK